MKNIILIITDTFRYDNLGNKAKRPVRTPELDRFAAERATSVERVHMGSFPTIPHRTDLTRGVLGWPHYPWQSLGQSGPNHAPALLSKAGYVSQLICDTPHLFNAGFQGGFTAGFRHRGQEGDLALLHMNDPIREAMPKEKTRAGSGFMEKNLPSLHRWTNRYFTREEDAFCSKTSATVIRWMEENYRFNPFFLWVDMFDPHEPWDPPEYMVRRYDPDYTGAPMIHPNYGPSSDYTPEELHNLWAHYAAESELVDRSIGRLLRRIDDLQMWDNTIVLVTADHGTSLGEHGRAAKGNICSHDNRFWPLYPEIGRVPFLIAGGGLPRGRSVDLIAQPIDILPTLCELAGAAVEPEVPFQGKSFAAPLLAGRGTHREVAVTGEYTKFTDPTALTVKDKGRSTPFLVTDDWGYAPLGAHGTRELYDLKADPFAENDVAADHASIITGLHDLFLDHLREHGADERLVALWKNR